MFVKVFMVHLFFNHLRQANRLKLLFFWEKKFHVSAFNDLKKKERKKKRLDLTVGNNVRNHFSSIVCTDTISSSQGTAAIVDLSSDLISQHR